MILRAAFALLWLQLLALVAGQSSGGPMELPAITGPAQGNQCGGGCYVVADVAGVFFGSQQLTQTETQIISVGVGKNGTNITTTSVVSPEGQFTFGTAGLVTGAGGGVQFAPGTVITVNGATLTSPTAYQVFSAYSVTSTTVSNGQCVAVGGDPIAVQPAFSVPIPAGAGPNFAVDAENSFISHVGLPTCSAGGANIAATTHTVVNSVTETSTTVGPITMMPQAISTMAPSTTQVGFIQAASSRLAALTSSSAAAASSSASAAATTTQVSVGTIVVVGNSTGAYTGPAISVYQPGKNVAPSARRTGTAMWAGIATFAVSLVACVLL